MLGYSTDGRVYHSVPPLQPAQLQPGTAVGWYVDANKLTHVLTRTPFRASLFKQGAWGDPTYSSPNGPALATQSHFQAVPHPADRSLLLLTRLAVHSQARISASVTGPHGTVVPILGKGSRFGGLLKTGSSSSAVLQPEARLAAGAPPPRCAHAAPGRVQLPRGRGRSVGTAEPPHAPLPLPLSDWQCPQAEQLVGDVRRSERRLLARAVVGRRDLDHVRAGEVDPTQRAQESERLRRREAADLRCPRARSEGRVEDVDVEREEDRAPPDSLADEACEAPGPERPQLVAREDRFAAIEQALALRGKTPQEASLAEMDELWDEAKAAEKAGFGRIEMHACVRGSR